MAKAWMTGTACLQTLMGGETRRNARNLPGNLQPARLQLQKEDKTLPPNPVQSQTGAIVEDVANGLQALNRVPCTTSLQLGQCCSHVA